jgi:hypothetical protein
MMAAMMAGSSSAAPAPQQPAPQPPKLSPEIEKLFKEQFEQQNSFPPPTSASIPVGIKKVPANEANIDETSFIPDDESEKK